MANGKRTRFAPVKSMLCAALCLALLVGTTFAWFSDEAKTGQTTITAGNLDVQLWEVDSIGGTVSGLGTGVPSLSKEITEEDQLFDIPADFLWEPGAMWKSKVFAVKNAGSLALQYTLTVRAEKDTGYTGDLDLSERVKMKFAPATSDDLDPAKKLEDTQKARQEYWDTLTDGSASEHGVLLPEQNSTPFVAVLYWEPAESTDLDPEANPDNKFNLSAEEYADNAPKVNFSLDVFATQASFENDSFGYMYDNIYVAKNDKELQKAVEEADNGDLIDVLPGTYSGDDFENLKPGVDVQGTRDEDGNPETVVDVNTKGLITSGGHISDVKFEKVGGVASTPSLVELTDGAVIENCKFDDIRGLSSSNLRSVKVDGSATIRGCEFLSGNQGITTNSTKNGVTGELLIENCIFRTVMFPLWLVNGNTEGHVTLRGCQFRGNGSTMYIGTTRSFKNSWFGPGLGYVFWWDKDEKLVPEDGEEGKVKIGRGITMENCTLLGATLEIYTDLTMSGNKFQYDAHINIMDYYLTIDSTDDDFTQCKRTQPGYSGARLFSGKSRIKNGPGTHQTPVDIFERTTIKINGKDPNPDWVGETKVTIPEK